MAGAAGQCNQLTNVPVAERAMIQGGSVSLTYPMLSRDNYASWAIKVRVFMEAQGVRDAVEPPTSTVVDNRRDKMALTAIYQGIPNNVLLSIAGKRTAREAGKRTAKETSLCHKIKDSDVHVDADADKELDKLKNTSRFKPDKAFGGASERASPRSGPIEFVKDVKEADCEEPVEEYFD